MVKVRTEAPIWAASSATWSDVRRCVPRQHLRGERGEARLVYRIGVAAVEHNDTRRTMGRRCVSTSITVSPWPA